MRQLEDLFNAVAEMARLAASGEHKVLMAERAEVWEQAVHRYSSVMLKLAGRVTVHPEWGSELEVRLRNIEGCVAHKIPVVEQFIFEKAGFA